MSPKGLISAFYLYFLFVVHAKKCESWQSLYKYRSQNGMCLFFNCQNTAFLVFSLDTLKDISKFHIFTTEANQDLNNQDFWMAWKQTKGLGFCRMNYCITQVLISKRFSFKGNCRLWTISQKFYYSSAIFRSPY